MCHLFSFKWPADCFRPAETQINALHLFRSFNLISPLTDPCDILQSSSSPCQDKKQFPRNPRIVPAFCVTVCAFVGFLANYYATHIRKTSYWIRILRSSRVERPKNWFNEAAQSPLGLTTTMISPRLLLVATIIIINNVVFVICL